MEKRIYQPPSATLLLPEVLCEISFPLDGSGAEIANSKKTSVEYYYEDEEYDEELDWFEDDDPWQ
jgi:hypothetical protein